MIRAGCCCTSAPGVDGDLISNPYLPDLRSGAGCGQSPRNQSCWSAGVVYYCRMGSDEEWPTLELIQATVDRFIDQLPGWTPTAAYGVALVPVSANGGSTWSFPVVNVGWLHRLPALVLGIVTGRRSGTDTYELSPADLRKAVELLSPAEAATMLLHPNLLAWRAMLEQLDSGADGRIVAVFVESLDDEASGPYDGVLRAQIARGEKSTLYV